MSYAIVRQAIAEKKQIICHFQGFDRQICPHVIGTKNGREQVLAYQFAGGSKSGLPPEGQWRCMPIAEIMTAKIQDGPWHTGQQHSKPQTCVDQVDLEVVY
jgi:hypothetical protein